MNLNELLMGSVMADQNASVFSGAGKQKGNGNQNTTTFGQILNSRLYEASGVSADTGRNNAGGCIKGRSDSTAAMREPLYKSYRQLMQTNRKPEKAVAEDLKNTATSNAAAERTDNRNKADSKAKRQEASNSILAILAQMLGVDQTKLETLLNQHGVQADELNDAQGLEKTVSVLSEIFGLEDGQAEALLELMQLINKSVALEQADQEITNVSDDTLMNEIGQKESELTNTASAHVPQKTDQASELIQQLRAHIIQKLDEYAKKLEDGQDTVVREIKEALLAFMGKAEEGKKSVINATAATSESTAADVDDIGLQDVSLSDQKDKQADEEADENSYQMMNRSNDHSTAPQSQRINMEMQQPEAFQIVNSDAVSQSEADMPETAVRQTLPAREIINQITEKAAVTLTHDKSEMVMELKPESLGRISLKVITENGIVMAKFVAENRQVQQVLESNMQILKDSLQRQGISVQSLSVSVRQDGAQTGEHKPQYANTQGIRRRSSAAGTAKSMGMINGFVEESAGSNPYLWDDSTINITA